MDEARTITDLDWMAPAPAADLDTPNRPETFRHRLLGPMDPKIARSLTEAQLHELERVLAPSTSRLPPVNVRITLPFLRHRCFLTVLAGPELRSAERLKADRAKYAIATVTNICFFGFLLGLLVPALIGLVHILAVAG